MSTKLRKNQVNQPGCRAIGIAATIVVMTTTTGVLAQTFNSGSTGADGDFDLTGTPSGTVINFDPKNEPRLVGKDPEGDHVYHFRRVVVPAGVTLRMLASWTNGPVYWLVSGVASEPLAVDIGGTVNLNGEPGYDQTLTTANRRPPIPGPGGYPGGLGGNHLSGDTRSGAAQPGFGPGGGAGGVTSAWGNTWGRGGTFVGGDFLVPLVGGSGGGGGSQDNFEWWGAGGGAGGGALLIASSKPMSISGAIMAEGGVGGLGRSDHCHFTGGSGSGGAIRLVAPEIRGGGSLLVRGAGSRGCRVEPAAGNGKVRLEAFQHNWTFAIHGRYTAGAPLNSFAPTTRPPFIQVTGIAGQAVRPDPTGSFDAADVTINSDEVVELTIQARYIPPGTIPKVTLFSLDGTDQHLDASPLVGTLEQSTATISAKFPAGFTRGYVRASWTAS